MEYISLKGDALLLFFTLNFVLPYSNPQKIIKAVLRKGDDLIVSKSNQFVVDLHQSVYETVSIELDGFSTCFNSHSRTSLLIFIHSQDQFLGTMRKIVQQATRIKMEKVYRQSYCEVYILNQTCHHYLPDYKIEDFQDPIATKSNSSAKHFPFDLHSDIYLIQYCESNECLKYWEMYSIKNRLFIKYIYQQKRFHRDMLNLNLEDFAMNAKPKIMRREYLDGLEVVASAFLTEGDENNNQYEVKVGADATGQAIFLSGLSVSILRDFRSVMNFTEKDQKIYFGTDDYFATAFTSGLFDINLFHVSVTKNRSAVAKPLHPTFYDGVHAVFVQPFDRSVRSIYQKPFALQLWRALLITWFSIFLSCKIVAYLQTKFLSETDKEDDLTASFEPGIWCIASMCQKGCKQLPTSVPIRIIIITSLVLSVVSYSAFTAKIVAELYNVPKSINSVKSLFSYAKQVYLIESSDTSYDILEGLEQSSPGIPKKIKFLPLDKIYSKLIKNPGRSCVITWPDIFTGYVYETLGEKTLTKSNVDAFICDTFTSFTYQSSSSLFVPKDSELDILFNYRIIVEIERGFIRHYWTTYKKQLYLSCLPNNSKVYTLEITHVFSAFVLLFGGMVIGFAFLISEMMIKRAGSKRS